MTRVVVTRNANIADRAVDRWVRSGRGDRVALRVLPADGPPYDVTYTDLAERSHRVASALAGAGLRPGDVVAVLLGRGLDLATTVLGALEHRCVVCPLFTAFGPEPIRARLALGRAAALVTTPGLYTRKVAGVRSELPDLRHVLVTGDEAVRPEGTISLAPTVTGVHDVHTIVPAAPEDLALLLFTSGTTGTPKGALHAHAAAATLMATGRDVLDLHEGDVSWCTADPGWVTGISYGLLAPLLCGATALLDEAELDPARWYATLADEGVSVWYTSPTAVRMLMRAGDGVPGIERPRPALRVAATVGEPLDPSVVGWARTVLHLELHDTWWQTETGGIMVAVAAGTPIRPGALGRAVPGVETALVRCTDDGTPVRTSTGDVELLDGAATGMLALRAGWPSMFRGYLDDDDRYAACFASVSRTRWYLTGDLVRRDVDGWLWFVARADDVIKSSGHLIGPCEVERVLNEHPAVVDSGVYGVPDEVAGALVHAAVVLADEATDDDATRASVLGYARRRLGASVAPRRILVTDELPRTRSGKTMRRVLRERELAGI